MRNFYLLTRTDKVGYDEFDSMIVLAETEQAARQIHPYGYIWNGTQWLKADGSSAPWFDCVWSKTGPDTLKVELIDPAIYEGDIVLSSFNAG